MATKNMLDYSVMTLYNSIAVFLLAAIALVVQSGYSYGAALLVVGSAVLLTARPSLKLNAHDWVLIFALLLYFSVNVLVNFTYGLPPRSYDRPLRVLLSIPAYLILVAYPPRPSFIFWGVVIGAIGAGVLSVHNRLFVGWWRYGGYLNPIQFGDISILLSGLSLAFALMYTELKKDILYLTSVLLAVLMGVTASISSESRGGWVALPFILLIVFFSSGVRLKKAFILMFALTFALIFSIYAALPEKNFVKVRVADTRAELIGSFGSDVRVENASVSTRLQMWENGWNAFLERPVYGWGDIMNIKSHFPEDWVYLNKFSDFNHLHNEYIDELAKRGVIGVISLLILYFSSLYYFYSVFRIAHNVESRSFAVAGIVLIIASMIFGLTQCFLAHNSGITIFIFLLVVIRAHCRLFYKKESAER